MCPVIRGPCESCSGQQNEKRHQSGDKCGYRRYSVNEIALPAEEFHVLAHCLEDAGGAHAAADAHGDHAVLDVAAWHFAQEGGGELRAGAAEGMAERDGAAVDVDLGGVEAEDFG